MKNFCFFLGLVIFKLKIFTQNPCGVGKWNPPDCDKDCPSNCELSREACEEIQGTCNKCQPGYYGEECQDKCMDTCYSCEDGNSCTKCNEIDKYGIKCNQNC